MSNYFGFHEELKFENKKLFDALNKYIYGFEDDDFYVLSLISKNDKESFSQYLEERDSANLVKLNSLKTQGYKVQNEHSLAKESEKTKKLKECIDLISTKSFPERKNISSSISYFLNTLKVKNSLNSKNINSDLFSPVISDANNVLEITELTKGYYFKYDRSNNFLFGIKDKQVIFFKEKDKKEIIEKMELIKSTLENKKTSKVKHKL